VITLIVKCGEFSQCLVVSHIAASSIVTLYISDPRLSFLVMADRKILQAIVA
jgi:hypothetical protein